ncbi:MAG: ABC transporter permease, partial [Erythrobacter sp.]
MLSPFEWMISKRYLWPGKGEAFIALVAGISVGVVMLSVAMLVIVMSVMNGFRGELLDKIVGLNGHAIVQAYGGKLDNWESVLEDVRETDGVTSASPLIEQPLLVSFNGRTVAILVRGQTQEDIDELADKVVAGEIAALASESGPNLRRADGPEAGAVAIGSRLAQNIGARVGDTITIINPQGRSTPFGTSIRQVPYEVGAIFEVGVYDYDEKFIIMTIPDAQTLLLMEDSIGMIEVTVDNADRVGQILQPVKDKLAGRAVVADWKTINAALFE